jgi:hypothetical protein
MEITAINSKGIFIKGKQASIAIDPLNDQFELDLQGKKPDIILSSKSFVEVPEVTTDVKYFSWPGDFEVKGVSIYSLVQYPEEQDEDKKYNVLVIGIDGLRLAYIRNLSKEMHSDLIEKIGDIDLLVISAADDEKVVTNTLEEIEPKALLPLISKTDLKLKEGFFQKQGLTIPEEQDKITINSRSDFQADKMGIYLLK